MLSTNSSYQILQRRWCLAACAQVIDNREDKQRYLVRRIPCAGAVFARNRLICKYAIPRYLNLSVCGWRESCGQRRTPTKRSEVFAEGVSAWPDGKGGLLKDFPACVQSVCRRANKTRSAVLFSCCREHAARLGKPPQNSAIAHSKERFGLSAPPWGVMPANIRRPVRPLLRHLLGKQSARIPKRLCYSEAFLVEGY